MDGWNQLDQTLLHLGKHDMFLQLKPSLGAPIRVIQRIKLVMTTLFEQVSTDGATSRLDRYTYNKPSTKTTIKPILVLLAMLSLTRIGRGIKRMMTSPTQDIMPLVRPIVSRVLGIQAPLWLLSQKNEGGEHWTMVPMKVPIIQTSEVHQTICETRRNFGVWKIDALNRMMEVLTQNKVGGWNFCCLVS